MEIKRDKDNIQWFCHCCHDTNTGKPQVSLAICKGYDP